MEKKMEEQAKQESDKRYHPIEHRVWCSSFNEYRKRELDAIKQSRTAQMKRKEEELKLKKELDNKYVQDRIEMENKNKEIEGTST
jgi:hypothetical protein